MTFPFSELTHDEGKMWNAASFQHISASNWLGRDLSGLSVHRFTSMGEREAGREGIGPPLKCLF